MSQSATSGDFDFVEYTICTVFRVKSHLIIISSVWTNDPLQCNFENSRADVHWRGKYRYPLAPLR